MKKFAKFWKAANFRLKFGLIVTLIFFIIGFVVYYVPHVNPFTFNTYPNKMCIRDSVSAINKKGSLPKESEMLEMAKLLGCSVMDFFADEEDLPETKPANEDEEDILRIYRGLSRRAKHEFMSMAYEFENREELEGDKGTTAAV